MKAIANTKDVAATLVEQIARQAARLAVEDLVAEHYHPLLSETLKAVFHAEVERLFREDPVIKEQLHRRLLEYVTGEGSTN